MPISEYFGPKDQDEGIRTIQRAIDIGYRAQYLDEVSVDLTPSGQLSKATMGDHWEHQARIGLRANIW